MYVNNANSKNMMGIDKTTIMNVACKKRIEKLTVGLKYRKFRN